MDQLEVIRCRRCDRCLAERQGELLLIPRRGRSVRFEGVGVFQIECPNCFEVNRVELSKN